MTPERWRQVTDIFHAALTHDTSARASYLDRACAGDRPLREEIDAMLAAHMIPVDVSLTATPRLASGTMIGPYRIAELIGAGGMGEVYRARDTKLGREVALKILPQGFTADPERLARFTREAQVLASLNHPNIAAIYGFEESGGVRALVMELVEGEDLSQRIARGAVPLEDALPIAKQIVDALDAAHEQGIVHRDLKPANVKVRPDGVVKVLDFGLARAISPTVSSADVSPSPTITTPSMIEAGIMLGTAAYMSPEQARGRVVDKRTDIWAFGCVLYEMLTGARPFEGEDVTETIGAVIHTEPTWSRVPASTPSSVWTVLRRALEKDPKQRLRDIGDVRLALEGAFETAAPQSAPPAHSPSLAKHNGWVVAALAALLAAVALIGWLGTGDQGSESPSMTVTILPPSGTQLGNVSSMNSAPELSPDGSAVVYVAGDRRGGGYYVRRLDSLEAKLLPSPASLDGPVFWSPDSTTVVYPDSGHQLIKVRLPDGVPHPITQIADFTRQGSWSDNGTILIGTSSGGLMAVPASGGAARAVEVSGMGAGRYTNPAFLPGTEDFLFLFVPADTNEGAGVYLARLRDGQGIDPVLLLRNPTAARYTPAGGGRLLFVRDDNLYTQKLNRTDRTLEGEADLVVQGVASQPVVDVARADFSVARNGTLAWRPGRAALSQVTVFDRQGQQVGTAGPPGSATSIFLSPDETRLLATGESGAWLVEVGQAARQTLPADTYWFGWSRDGSTVLGGRKKERLMAFAANGSGEVRDLGRVGFRGEPHDISSDGTQLLSQEFVSEDGGHSLLVTQLEGTEGERTPRSLVTTDELIWAPRFSPDGRWLAYESGGTIFVQPFPGPGRRQQVVPTGATPEWRKDGKEIVYLDYGSVMAVAAETAAGQLRFGAPHRLFSGLRGPLAANRSDRLLAVSKDGSRVFWLQGVEQPESNFIHVKTGWARE